jgi:hypothetical protein
LSRVNAEKFVRRLTLIDADLKDSDPQITRKARKSTSPTGFWLSFPPKGGIFRKQEPLMDARKGAGQNPPFNAVTLAALREAEAVATGNIQVEWQHPPATKEESKVQIRKRQEVVVLFGKIEFDESYDYKKSREKR